jgi:hypothetical protein
MEVKLLFMEQMYQQHVRGTGSAGRSEFQASGFLY